MFSMFIVHFERTQAAGKKNNGKSSNFPWSLHLMQLLMVKIKKTISPNKYLCSSNTAQPQFRSQFSVCTSVVALLIKTNHDIRYTGNNNCYMYKQCLLLYHITYMLQLLYKLVLKTDLFLLVFFLSLLLCLSGIFFSYFGLNLEIRVGLVHFFLLSNNAEC